MVRVVVLLLLLLVLLVSTYRLSRASLANSLSSRAGGARSCMELRDNTSELRWHGQRTLAPAAIEFGTDRDAQGCLQRVAQGLDLPARMVLAERQVAAQREVRVRVQLARGVHVMSMLEGNVRHARRPLIEEARLEKRLLASLAQTLSGGAEGGGGEGGGGADLSCLRGSPSPPAMATHYPLRGLRVVAHARVLKQVRAVLVAGGHMFINGPAALDEHAAAQKAALSNALSGRNPYILAPLARLDPRACHVLEERGAVKVALGCDLVAHHPTALCGAIVQEGAGADTRVALVAFLTVVHERTARPTTIKGCRICRKPTRDNLRQATPRARIRRAQRIVGQLQAPLLRHWNRPPCQLARRLDHDAEQRQAQLALECGLVRRHVGGGVGLQRDAHGRVRAFELLQLLVERTYKVPQARQARRLSILPV